MTSRRRRPALTPCPNCASLQAEREALLIDCERLRKDRNAAFDRVELTHGPECSKLDRRRIEEAEAETAKAIVNWALRQAERDRLREALLIVVWTLRGDGDEAAKADAAYSVAAEALRALARHKLPPNPAAKGERP